MTALPSQAREGLMRAWLEILRERHPGTNWLPAANRDSEHEPQQAERREELVAV